MNKKAKILHFIDYVKIREEDDEDTQIEEDSLFGQQSSSKEKKP